MEIVHSLEYNMQLLNSGQPNPAVFYDYLLVACGSDFRAYQLLRQNFGMTFGKLLLFNFLERRASSEPQMLKALDSYKDLAKDSQLIDCSIKDPSSAVKALASLGVRFDASSKVALDISCFTKPYFFCLLKYLKEQTQINKVAALYTEPMSYVFSKGLYSGGYHSTSGPLAVTEIPGFPGNDTRTKAKKLVVLLGFDGELTSFISEEVAPDETVVVNGFPAYAPKFKEISLISNEKLLSVSGTNSILFARASSPFETFNLLDSLYKQEPSSFFNIAPLGTKPMALGACLFALDHPSVRIVYPLPEKYADVTTEECWNSWLYQIPLRDLGHQEAHNAK